MNSCSQCLHCRGMIHEVKAAVEIGREIVAEAGRILRERPGQMLQ